MKTSNLKLNLSQKLQAPCIFQLRTVAKPIQKLRSKSKTLFFDPKKIYQPKHLVQIITQSSSNPNLPYKSDSLLKAETTKFSEKSKILSAKLSNLLLSNSDTSTPFEKYSAIYNELSDFLIDFKDLLKLLFEGLVSSAVNENNKFADLEHKKKVSEEYLKCIEKERKEKLVLTGKLNRLNNEFILLRNEFETMKVEYLHYKEVVRSDPQKFIDANSLVEKMMGQWSIIEMQKNYISQLQSEVCSKGLSNTVD